MWGVCSHACRPGCAVMHAGLGVQSCMQAWVSSHACRPTSMGYTTKACRHGYMTKACRHVYMTKACMRYAAAWTGCMTNAGGVHD